MQAENIYTQSAAIISRMWDTVYKAEIWQDSLQSRLVGSSRSLCHIVAVVMLQYFFNLFAPLQRIAFLIFEVVCSIRLYAHVHKTNVTKHCSLNKQ